MEEHRGRTGREDPLRELARRRRKGWRWSAAWVVLACIAYVVGLMVVYTVVAPNVGGILYQSPQVLLPLPFAAAIIAAAALAAGDVVRRRMSGEWDELKLTGLSAGEIATGLLIPQLRLPVVAVLSLVACWVVVLVGDAGLDRDTYTFFLVFGILPATALPPAGMGGVWAGMVARDRTSAVAMAGGGILAVEWLIGAGSLAVVRALYPGHFAWNPLPWHGVFLRSRAPGAGGGAAVFCLVGVAAHLALGLLLWRSAVRRVREADP